MNRDEIEKYYSMEERQKRLNLETAPDTEENRKKRAEMRAKEFENRGELQKQFEKENFRGRGGGGGSGAGVDIEGLPKKLKSGPKNFKSGGKVGSASKRADGCATKGKTRGKIV